MVIEGGLYHVYKRFARGEDVFADPEEAVEFAELLREVKQRAGRLASLLNKHTVAVSRWVAEAARQRQRDSEYEEEMNRLDEQLSIWALDAQARGLPVPLGLNERAPG